MADKTSLEGKIIKGIAGFYYVYADDGITYECKAKGSFRKNGIKPLIGDNVKIDIIDRENKEGNITSVMKRNNRLIRPEVSNIDQALVVVAVKNPEPNYVMLDKLLLQFRAKDIPVILCFNKTDLADDDLMNDILDIYGQSQITICVTSADTGYGIDELMKLLCGKVTAIAGPSGVGKSSIINCLQPEIQMETGEISDKLKRGRHTTRHSQIIPISSKTFIIDTPGFTSMDVFDVSEYDLCKYYPEFEQYNGCYFVPCSHIHEPDCDVKCAVEEGKINKKRYENYIHIYDEIKRSRKY